MRVRPKKEESYSVEKHAHSLSIVEAAEGYPYQITALGEETVFTRVGDFHDTLQSDGGSATIRFATDFWTGKVVLHCHVLEHEDEGLMAYVHVQGKEGTVVDAAVSLTEGVDR